MKRYRTNIIAACLLGLFAAYFASVTLFLHIHLVNGRVVAHSHPYSGTRDKPAHDHSAGQILIIALLSVVVALAAAIVAGRSIFRRSLLVRIGADDGPYATALLSFNPLRGPPLRP